MREHLYRAWDTINKRMNTLPLFGNIWGITKKEILIKPAFSGMRVFCKRKDGILMLYLGVTDKNGKKIAQDDIVKENGKLHLVKYGLLQHETIHEVSVGNDKVETEDEVYETLGFYLAEINMEGRDSDELYHERIWNNVEVVGNKHENPELLG